MMNGDMFLLFSKQKMSVHHWHLNKACMMHVNILRAISIDGNVELILYFINAFNKAWKEFFWLSGIHKTICLNCNNSSTNSISKSSSYIFTKFSALNLSSVWSMSSKCKKIQIFHWIHCTLLFVYLNYWLNHQW